MRACSSAVSWQPLLETINSRKHTCAPIQTWNKLQARFAWRRMIVFFMDCNRCTKSKLLFKCEAEKIELKSSHRRSQVSVHKHWMLEWENSVQCLVNLDGPIELCCMSGLVAALVIFRSSLASLMGPWGAINSPRACVQDRKAPKILLRSLVLQRFPDKKFTRPPDYHRLTSPSAMWCRKGCHKECLQS